MREKLPLEALMREIVDDELSEAPAKSREVSQEDIGEIVARKRASARKRADEPQP